MKMAMRKPRCGTSGGWDENRYRSLRTNNRPYSWIPRGHDSWWHLVTITYIPYPSSLATITIINIGQTLGVWMIFSSLPFWTIKGQYLLTISHASSIQWKRSHWFTQNLVAILNSNWLSYNQSPRLCLLHRHCWWSTQLSSCVTRNPLSVTQWTNHARNTCCLLRKITVFVDWTNMYI